MVQLRPHLGFLLLLPSPIPVEIKPVMVGASAGPWLVVFHCSWVWIGWETRELIEPDGVPVVSIGIQTRIQNDDQLLHHRVARGTSLSQGVHHFECRLGAHSFVSVNVVAHPNDRQIVVGLYAGPAADAIEVLRSNLFEERPVFGMGKDQCLEGAAFIRLAILHEGNAGCFSQIRCVIDDFMVQREPISQCKT